MRSTRLAVWPATLPQTLPAVPALWNPARTTRGTDKDCTWVAGERVVVKIWLV